MSGMPAVQAAVISPFDAKQPRSMQVDKDDAGNDYEDADEPGEDAVVRTIFHLHACRI